MFEKSLQDMVKGIRNAGNDATAYTAKCIQEIKDELKNRDVTVKTQALLKLIYLNMLGHDMTFASFHIIEVMSQERFGLKRVGLLAASQSFTASTDVIVLCTQLLKKEFMAKSPYEIGLGINTLANIATEDLARDLLSDVVSMLTSSRPYIRKKATLVLYKLYVRYPQGLRLTFDHLKRRLADDTIAVQCAAVNVICELARRKPENYLELAPDLFALLASSTHTWMTIKVTKLLASLVVVEPRLARKLLEPLATIVQSTPAKSLQYEAINALTVALQHTKKADGTDAKNVPTVVRLITDRLREFAREPDQNLKYLGLTGLVNLMKSHPRVVAEHRELVLQCLMDEDVTIRLRALELIAGMVTRRNLPDIVSSLMTHLETAEGHYRDELIDKIITMCSRDKYAYLEDFGWYIGVLAKLAYLPGIARHGGTIAGQMIDVAVRVEDARPNAVQALLPMLADTVLFQNARSGGVDSTTLTTSTVPQDMSDGAAPMSEAAAAAAVLSGTTGTGASQVLYAAAWIVGEYSSIIPARMHGNVLDALLQPSVQLLPAGVQSAYVQCSLKVLAAAAASALKGGESGPSAPFLAQASSVLTRLHPFAQSVHVEVQERACLVQQLLATLGVPFTPVPTKMSEAAAKAKAEEELLALAGGEEVKAPSSPTKGPVGANAPPLEADVRLIAGVLASLFSEALRPVNAKAQRKVAVPEGLSLEAWINAEEAAGDVEERSGRSALMYSSVSFEDSYGVKDDEYAGGKGGEPSGPKMYDMGAADSDDEEWFNDMAKKNKKRDKELWGDDKEDKKGKKGKKGKKDKDSEDEEAPRKGRKGKGGDDAFMLKSGKAGRGNSDDLDVDSIPMKKLAADDLKPNALSMDISIFGDFGGKKGKAGDAKKGKKGKKGKGDDSDDDMPAPTKARRIIDDDDLPPGASADDDTKDEDQIADALASVDLRRPLGEDEVLTVHRHRAVGDPAALQAVGDRRGRGRARVLGEADAAAPPSSKDGKDAKKGDKKEKKDKKEEEPLKKDKKASKEAPAPVKEEEKPKKKEKKAKEAEAPSGPKHGEEVAAGEPFEYQLCKDKVVRVAYIVSSDPSGSAATLSIRVEPKSSKKGVEWLDVALPEGTPLTGGVAGAASGCLRLATGMKPKDKEKPKAGKKASLTLSLTPEIIAAGLSVPVKVTYQVAGGATASMDAVLTVRAGSLLVPTTTDTEAYRGLMTTEGAAFEGTAGTVPLLGGDGDATIAAAVGIFRGFAVARSPKHAILYAKTPGPASAHVTAVFKVDDASGALQVMIKSLLPGHAAALLKDVTEAMAIIAAEGKGKDDE